MAKIEEQMIIEKFFSQNVNLIRYEYVALNAKYCLKTSDKGIGLCIWLTFITANT